MFEELAIMHDYSRLRCTCLNVRVTLNERELEGELEEKEMYVINDYGK